MVCIQEHRVFRDNRYRDDTRIYPQLQQHITKSFVRKNEMSNINTLVTHLRTDVADLKADQKDMRDFLILIEAKLGRIEKQCGGGGGNDGDAGGGAVKLGKNVKKRKERRAQAGDDAQE